MRLAHRLFLNYLVIGGPRAADPIILTEYLDTVKFCDIISSGQNILGARDGIQGHRRRRDEAG